MDERKRILNLVENGTISADEAIKLLEALSKQKEPTQSTAPVANVEVKEQAANEEPTSTFESREDSSQRKTTGFEDIFGKAFNKETNKKMDEFMQELRSDLSEFSGRMMNMMNTTFSKIKDFDMEFPFGEKVEFDKTYAFDVEDVRGFEIDIPNGKVIVEKSVEPKVFIEAHVKMQRKESEQDLIERFLENFVQLKSGKIEISTQSKMSHVDLRVFVPEKQYEVFVVRLLNGGITFSEVEAKLVKAKTYNGAVKAEKTIFDHADLQSANGVVEALGVKGEDLEAETANGRIYIDGDIKEVEAESVNGHVVVTTTSNAAHKVKARTVAGSVELYIPKNVSLDGRVISNFGKTDVGLPDVTAHSTEDGFMLKTVRFDKIVEDAPLLKLVGESRTGTVIVRYTLKGE